MRLKHFLFCLWIAVLSLILLVQPSFSQQGGIGVLEVLIEGGGDGGRWRADGGPWNGSGVSLRVTLGSHTVEFKDTEGWTKPAAQTVNVVRSDRVTVVRGRYIPTTGFINVVIQPAFQAGTAGWMVDGNGTLRDSGQTIGNLTPGSHTIRFARVRGGWTTPAAQTVNVVAGQTTRVTGTYAPPGSIRVTIQPANTGAWRVSSVSSDHEGYYWKSSDMEVRGLSAGNHTVEFGDVRDWTKPAAQTINVVAGQTTQVAGTYTSAVGHIEVTIQPANTGAWRVDRGPWRNSGFIDRNLTPGSHTVDFQDIPGWSKPAPQTVNVRAPQTTRITGRYTQIPGSLRVALSPDGAAAQAQWRVVSSVGVWKTSNQVVENLDPGSYTIEFSNLTGWTRPANQTVNVSSGQTTQLTVEYQQSIGSLVVTIQPQEAVARGARWRMDGGPWIASGSVQSWVSVGQKNIEFQEISGWIRPAGETISVNGRQTTNIVKNYIQQGSLQVTIVGGDTAGRWHLGEIIDWKPSEFVMGELNPGPKRIQFMDVNGWTKPAAMDVTITSGQTQRVTATYTRPAGSLRVNIQPDQAGAAGAQWRVDGGTWQNSGSTLPNVNTGSRSIEYKEIPGWTGPASETATINAGQTTALVKNYTPQLGSLQVTIIGSGGDFAGRWQVDNRGWKASNVIQANVSPGQKRIEFNDVPGWIKPAPIDVNITAGQLQRVSATYTRSTGLLRVVIQPGNVESAGARWRIDGGPWQPSRQPLDNIAVGAHQVEYSDVAGWVKPPTAPVNIIGGQSTHITGTYQRR